MNRNQIIGLITSIGQRQGLSPQQIRVMIATAQHESSLNPRATGDGGTSFGLFQHHIGGAGGRTRQSAMRYYDPVTSITERAQWFKRNNITSGRGAAALQRPANPGSYANAVDALMRGVKVGLNAPVTGGNTEAGGVSEPAPTVSSGRPVNAAAGVFFESVFKDNPTMLALYRAKTARDARTAAATPDPVEPPDATGSVPGQGGGSAPATDSGPVPGVGVLPRKKGEPAWRYLQRLGNTLFGLRNDPGDSQTTGGVHSSPKSWHYSGRAIDFGDARNPRSKLNAWLKWVNAHKNELGVGQAYDEHDHIHIGLRR